MKRLLPGLMPALSLLAAGCYLLLPPFALAVNQLCEMLGTGNTRGLMMVYHSAGSLGAVAAAAGISALALLVPVFKSHYLISANTGYFGLWAGYGITALGGLLAVILVLLWCKTLSALIPQSLKKAVAPPDHRWSLVLIGAAALVLLRLL